MYQVSGIIVTIICLGLAACQSEAPPLRMVQVASQDSVYLVKVPSFLQPGFDMHPFASIQYYDTATQFFVLGMEDAKDNLGAIKRRRLKLKGYFNYMETTVLERVDSFINEAGFRDTLTQGLVIQSQDYFAVSDTAREHPLFYRISAFENDEFFVQLVIWMPYQIHCDYITWVDSITRSLEFLPPYQRFTMAGQ